MAQYSSEACDNTLCSLNSGMEHWKHFPAHLKAVIPGEVQKFKAPENSAQGKTERVKNGLWLWRHDLSRWNFYNYHKYVTNLIIIKTMTVTMAWKQRNKLCNLGSKSNLYYQSVEGKAKTWSPAMKDCTCKSSTHFRPRSASRSDLISSWTWGRMDHRHWKGETS